MIDTTALWVCPACGGVYRPRAARWHRKYEDENADAARLARRRARHREDQRRYAAAHPERVRDIQRRSRQRTQADPSRRAEHNAKQRICYRLRVDRPVSANHPARDEPYRRELSQTERLDIGPFARWLREMFPHTDASDVAAIVGCEAKQVRGVLAGTQRTIGLTVVDRAFVRAGHPYLLHVLYPVP